MVAGERRDSPMRALEQSGTRRVGMHRRSVPEPFCPRVRRVDRASPRPCARTRPAGDGHRCASASGPQSGQVEQADLAREGEADQPRLAMAHVDGSSRLEELGKCRGRVCCPIQNPSLLRAAREFVGIETAVERSVEAEAVPGARVRTGPAVDTKEGRPSRNDPPIWRDHRQLIGWSWQLRRRRTPRPAWPGFADCRLPGETIVARPARHRDLQGQHAAA